jgi:hypothetical protein
VTGDEAVLDLWRADLNALHILDLVAPIVTSAAWLPHLIMVAKASDQFSLEFSAGVHVDGVVDGLVGHRFLGIFEPKGIEFERYLLR